MANYSFQDPTETQVPEGSVIDGGNFSQLLPDTPIMVGRTLTINGGNFTNVRKDPNWTVNGGNFFQVSRCTNLDPDWIERGIPACDVNCSHVVDTDVLEIDGVEVETVYYYEETITRG